MKLDHHRVVITGMGAVSALGTGVDAMWNGLLTGRCGIRTVSRFINAGLPATSGGEVLKPPHDRIDRDEVIAKLAIEGAVSMAHFRAMEAGFIWATGLDTFQTTPVGLTHRSAGACFSALAQNFSGLQRMIATACASGTQAIGEAYQLLKRGKGEAFVAGGSSVMLTPFYVMGFAGLQAIALDQPGERPAAACRPFDHKRRGLVLGDGAGALVLETFAAAKRRGATPLAEIIGFGVSQDAFDLNRPPENGAGAELCMRRALANAGLAADDVGAINAHGTGTFAGDLA